MAPKAQVQKKLKAEETKKVPVAESSDDSDDSSEEETTKKVAVPVNKKVQKAEVKAAVKQVVAKKQAESSSDDSSEEEAKPAQKKVGTVLAKAQAPAKKIAKKESSDSSEESSEEEKPVTKKAIVPPVKAVAQAPKKVIAKKESSDDEDSSEEEKPAPKKSAPATKSVVAPKAVVAPKKAPVKEESSEDDSSEEEKPPVKKAVPATKVVAATKAPIVSTKKAPAKEESSDDDSSEEEKPAPKKGAAVVAKTAPPAKKVTSKDSSSEEDDEEEEVQKPAPKKAEKMEIEKAVPAQKAPVNTQQNNHATNNAQGGDKFTNEVIIKGLSFSSDENDIGNFLEEKFGAVTRVNILRNEDKRSKGIAFVTFETEEGCNKAVEGSGVELQERSLIIEKTKPKGERPAHLPVDEESKTIFVGNLPFTCDTESLKQFFASCGTVLDARIAQLEGKSRGFGHVEFTDKSGVENGLKKAGESFQGRPIKVDVAASRGKREGYNRGNGSFNNNSRGAPRGDFQNERKGAIAEFKGQVKSL